MALKSTIHKVQLQISDLDRQLYATHALTLALHPSETHERLMVRLLAFALQVPHDDSRGDLRFARGLSDTEEPDLWQHDLTGQLLHWLEVGQPDERRLARACGRAARVTVYAYGSTAATWWAAAQRQLDRVINLAVWQIPPEQSKALASVAQRAMSWQLTVQDGHVWLHADGHDVEITPRALRSMADAR
jgi:uncharacterized protein YaeQ